MLKKITYKKFIHNASLFFALLIAFWLPELKFILSYFIGAWFLFSILQVNYKKNFKQGLNSNYKKIVFIAQLLLFFLIVSELLYADDNSNVIKNVIQKLSIFIFPLLFSLNGKLFKIKENLFLKLFVFSNVLASLLCLFFAFYNSLSFVDGHIIFNTIAYGQHSYFRGVDFSLFIHRGYYSMFLVFSVAIVFYLYEIKAWFKKSKYKVFFYLLVLFFSIIIFLLESRAGIISLFLLISCFVIYKIFSLKNKIYKMTTIIFIIFLAFTVLQNDRIHSTLKKVTSINTTVGSNSDVRLVLWSAAIDIIESDFFTGVGIENFKKVFSSKYEKYNNKEIQSAMGMNYNVHNQFLEIWVIYGLSGFIIFSLIFFLPLIIAIKEKQYLFIAFLLIVLFNFLLESIIETISGIIFTIYFLNFFVFVFEHKKSQITK